MEIFLDLKKHCIQTAIKRKYNQRISKYFKINKSENTEIIEAQIALLKEALENLNFSYLRSTYPELQGGGEDKIILKKNTDNQITILINGGKIHAIYKNHQLL
jgi:hypothetical protein